MSENQLRGSRDFSKYDSMATEDLEQILRSDVDAPAGHESDTEFLLYIMGVLADRKRNSNSADHTALEAFESFKRNYLPCNSNADVLKAVGKSAKKTTYWLRRITVAAAILVVILCTSLTAKALGVDIWNVVASWANETFHFAREGQVDMSEPSPEDAIAYGSLQEILSANGRDFKLIPAWIPDGYELVEIKTDETPMQETYIAIYSNADKIFKINVKSYLNADPEKIEISDNLQEIYEVGGTEYYIFKDNKQYRVTWISNNFECYLTGELTKDEVLKIIESTQKG